MLIALRAAAEPTRLRLFALLTHGELTVGEISTVLEQSQPRISRHLKMMCDAGLLDRFREEHWVYYRVSMLGIGNDFAQRIAPLLASDDATLVADQRRMAMVLSERLKDVIAAKETPPALSELHDALIDDLSGQPIGELLDIGTGTGLMLRAIGANASRAVGVDISTEALRIARSQAHGAGLSHCMFRRGDMYALPFGQASFDTVTMDRVLASSEQPANAIAEAVRILRGGGRLCLVEEFDALAERTSNPFAMIRAWLESAGLKCERIHPLDIQSGTESAHVLLVIARAPTLVQAAA